MRSIPLLLAAVLVAGSALGMPKSVAPDDRAGSRHVWLQAEHPLSQEEIAALRESGVTVVRPVGGDRYIARLNRAVEAKDVVNSAVARVAEIEPGAKIFPSATREASSDAMARIDIVFQPDIDFAIAKSRIIEAGGSLRNPTAEDFVSVQTIEAVFPSDAISKLAAVDEVLQIHGAIGKLALHNAIAAQLANVEPLYEAPYNLSGNGVKVSMWDGGAVQSSHPEFGGRVIGETNAGIDQHATHVAGTIGARGDRTGAKGMAPAVTIHSFQVDDGFLESKQNNFPRITPVADNNSWGYVIGWFWDDTLSKKWDWWGAVEEFGAYGVATAGVDKLTRDSGTLIVFSAGNDNSETGPGASPFAHHHEGKSTIWCVSPNGNSTGCAAECAQCEPERHPADGPFRSMSHTGAGKNVIAVGAVDSQQRVGSFSSRGPTTDGRVKPDVVAKGVSQYSTFPTNSYGYLQGTSMAAPVVTGIAALLAEQWKLTFGGALPGPEALRGLLIHGARDLGEAGPDYTYGFGLVDAKASVDTIIADAGAQKRIKRGSAVQGTQEETIVALEQGGIARLTLVWSDPENIPYPAKVLINDLDLVVVGPDGASYRPYVFNPTDPTAVATTGINSRDNVEQVEISNATVGDYRVRVTGTQVASATPQSYVLLSSVDFGPGRVACVDPFEPNNSEAEAWGRLPRAATLRPTFCESGDVDFYRFTVDRSGPVVVTVKNPTAPIRVTLTWSGGTQTADAAAGSTATLQTSVGSGTGQPITPVAFTVKVEVLAALTAAAPYEIRATYSSSQPNRRRTVRR